MAERKWTAEQRAAIDTRDKTLLVSAAAGSGKTATLTERIISTLTDTENETSVSELLVVTYTNAAAAEMRQRIGASLKSACERNPESKHLMRQLMLLPSAKIRTIDSFCGDILRSNVDRVGIAPNYRILDDAEGQLLAFDILETLIGDIYGGNARNVAEPEEFESLADCLTSSKKMQRLSEIIYALYESTAYEEDQFATLDSYCEACNPKTLAGGKNIFLDFYVKKLHEMCEHFIRVASALAKELECGAPEEREYTGTFIADADAFGALLARKDYFELCRALEDFAWPDIPAKKRGIELTELQAYVKEKRNKYKGKLKDLKERAFSFEITDIEHCFEGLYSRLTTLVNVLRRFDELFMAEKRRRAAFSYNDVERFTYNTLWQDGQRTDIAISLMKDYKYIYIDEYQDVNAIQDKIFEAIARENNRFMVGDIKQSIYRFRGGEAKIFADMKKGFPKLGDSNLPYASIFMSENFRCDKGIIDFVNEVFDKVFGAVGENIGYEPDDRLRYGKGAVEKDAPPEHITNVIIVEDLPTSMEQERLMLEPCVMAREIKRLVSEEKLNDGSPIRPKDIAIIMRSTKDRARDYAAAISALGIPAHVSGQKNFFLNREILLALCLLNSIDNPQRDIYMAGLLRSPLYDFTADELLLISREMRGSLYSSLVSYCEKNPDFKKGSDFISALKRYRRIAESTSISALLYKLYRETGLLALASKNDGKDNLTLLYNYAMEFEGREYKGLYGFISFINEIIAKGSQFDAKMSSADADEVSIITTHSSKGLEYPVVFLAECSKQLTSTRKIANVGYTRGFGISFPLRTSEGLGIVDGLPDFAIPDYERECDFEEELRVLYVALTRARERLYVVGKEKLAHEYLEEMRDAGEIITPYSVKSCKSSLDVMCLAHPVSARYTVAEDFENILFGIRGILSVNSDPLSDSKEYCLEESAKEQSDDGVSSVTSKELVSRFNFIYKNEYLTKLPEKISVSRLSPAVLDGTDMTVPDILSEAETGEDEQKRIYPDFYTGLPADESAKRGIATHLFMQFCDLQNIKANGAENELLRLLDKGFITPADKERVRLREIKLFEESELFRAMLDARKIYRELRFNVRMPASMFTENEDKRTNVSAKKILVQGVIDCIIEQNDGTLRLIDYKTDRLAPTELADISLAKKTLSEKHKIQLGYYAMAVESIFGKKPLSTEVYSLPLGRCVDIDI